MREIKEPLTIETLGKYFYKFYYLNKVINDKDNQASKKRISNTLTKLMIKFIDRERYIEDKLSMRVTKNGKKDMDYRDFLLEKILTK